MFNLHVPTRVLFGCGQLNELHAQPMPGKKAMIVVSNGKSVKVNGYLARTEEQLHQAGIETVLYDKIEANPLRQTVTAGGQMAAASGADFLVALGGGSVIDASKGIAVVAANGGDVWDYITNGTGKGMPIEKTPLPIIAITTTAGTGSETDMGGVITNQETKEKTPIKGPQLFPQLAIIDPELMASVPPRFTAYQGFDALFHNIEGYIANKSSLMSEMIALTAIEAISQYLPIAVKDGKNLTAREKVAFGSYLGGLEMVVCSTVSGTFHGTFSQRFSSGTASWGRPDYAQRILFYILYRTSRLRRPFRPPGPGPGYDGSDGTKRFHHSSAAAAERLWCSRSENVRLWHHAG